MRGSESHCAFSRPWRPLPSRFLWLAGRDVIQRGFHASCVVVGEDGCEATHQVVRQLEAFAGGDELFLLKADVTPRLDVAQDGGVGTWAPDTALFQLAHQSSFGVTRGRSGLSLLRNNLLELQDLTLLQKWQFCILVRDIFIFVLVRLCFLFKRNSYFHFLDSQNFFEFFFQTSQLFSPQWHTVGSHPKHEEKQFKEQEGPYQTRPARCLSADMDLARSQQQ